MPLRRNTPKPKYSKTIPLKTTQKYVKMSHRSILQSLLNFFENPKYPSVGPHLRLLGITGLWHSHKTPLIKFKLIIFYVIISFFFSQYIKLFINLNSDSLQLILQYAPFHMGTVKTCLFRKDKKRWEELISYLSALECDQLAKNDAEFDKVIRKYIGRNRRITYFFWCLSLVTNTFLFSVHYQKNQANESVYLHIFEGYTPFSREPPGYYATMLIETVAGNIMSMYIVGWDTMVISIMLFFAGQLKIARLYCVHIMDNDNAKSHQNIAEFHRFYTTIIRYQEMFNSLISPVMFVYLIVISVNLGVVIIQLVQIANDVGTLVSSCVFMAACLIQLLLFYWHSNEVTEESLMVNYGTFESDWTDRDKHLLKKVSLLATMTRKRLVFMAGPFSEMSLANFVGVLRGSYSFYTLLKGTSAHDD